MELSGADEIEATQRRLVQCGKCHTEDGQKNINLIDEGTPFEHAGETVGEPFTGRNRELHKEHRQIGRNAQADFKEYGSRAREEEHKGQAQGMT